MSFILIRAHSILLGLGVIYGLFLLSLTLPFVQTALIYHWVRFPFNADFNSPAKYGLAPGKVRNIHITTSDGVNLGAWHILPQSTFDTHRNSSLQVSLDVFDSALNEKPVYLYFHGNAANRAASFRTKLATHVSTHLNNNFVIVDYRGFGDSDRVTPSETGLKTDALSVWNWLTRDQGVPNQNIIIAGQSLGTGVATHLAAHLSVLQKPPKALILVAPFTSIAELLETYKLGTVLPVLGPLRTVPIVKKLLMKALRTKFETKHMIKNVTCPIMLVHSQDDYDIPLSHSQTLYEIVVTDVEPSVIKPNSFQTTFKGPESEHTELPGFGALHRKPPVWFLEAQYGGHNEVGYSGTTLEVMKDFIANIDTKHMT